MAIDTITRDDVILEDEEPEEDEDEYFFNDEVHFEEKIIIPSPKVSIDENDIPIIVNNQTSFEEKLLAASPEAGVYQQLEQCDTCGRKFNKQALERHIKVCEKVAAKPKKVFDAVNKIWRNESDIEKIPPPKTAIKKKKSLSKRPEDLYKTCDYCRRKFCENAFDRHVEFCKEKSTRLSSSPVKDVVAQAKLFARTRYNPKEAKNGSRRCTASPSRKDSLVSLISEYSLPQWNMSGRNTPSYSNTYHNDAGNLRHGKKQSESFLSGTKSLGRAQGLQYLRQGDAARNSYDEDWDPESDAKATTLSRNNSGRGSIRRPALTKAAMLRFNAGEKKADDTEKKRITNEFGSVTGNLRPQEPASLRARSATPNSQLMSRSAHDYSSLGRADRRQAATPQLSRRSHSKAGSGTNGSGGSYPRPAPGRASSRDQPSPSPQPWQSFKPLSTFSMMTSARAEPDGIESDDHLKYKDTFEGGYDHSKEYDPFQTAERQMQELLFGSSSHKSEPGSGSSYSAVQKPQPVRPIAGSAFTAYAPGKGSGLDSLRTRTSYLTSLGPDTERWERVHYTVSTIHRDVPRPSYTEPKLGLARSSSLRAASTNNWKHLFPSLTRTPSTQHAEDQDVSSKGSSAPLARFCHECGSPFPGVHVRFCCDCGVRRLNIT